MEHKTKPLTWVLLIIASLVFVASIYAAYYYGLSKNSNRLVDFPSQFNNLPSPTVTPSLTDQSSFGAITWYSSPKKVSNPPILNTVADESQSFYPYIFAELGTYEVAKFANGNKILVAFIAPEGPSMPVPIRLISTPNENYFLVSNLLQEDVREEIKHVIKPEKIKEIFYDIPELVADAGSLTVNNQLFVKYDMMMSRIFVTEIKNYKIYSQVNNNPFLKITLPLSNTSSLVTNAYYLQLKDFTLVPYTPSSVLSTTNNKVPYFKYTDNRENKTVFTRKDFGCSSEPSEGLVVSDITTLGDKVLIGHTNDNPSTDIYHITNTNNPIIKYLYSEYKMGRDYPEANPPPLSIEQFSQQLTHIIFQEKNGDWVILVNPEYGTQAECGKPVIYLYPPKDTQVSVKVGADITKSEPNYPQNGWTVLAHPNGQLGYQDRIYSNLFWEGTGHGLYPNIGNYGFVVKKENLASTIKTHLSLQGLNQAEIQDFMDFWEAKLPQTPYTRLTWLTTSQMNTLAPLSVHPRPDTIIRVFLDFKGLDKPIALIPQKLSAPTRNGFTLVEWGGLLVH